MRSLSAISSVAVAVAIGTTALPADAQTTVDQQSTVNANGFFSDFVTGQSFTASANRIDFASFNIQPQQSIPVSFSLNLYSGIGYNNFLSSSNSAIIQPNTITPTSFSFSSGVPLTVGNSYTLRVISSSAEFFQLGGSRANPYSLGSAVDRNGIARPDFDLVFSEGRVQGAAPEPETWALLIMGFGIVGASLRRKRLSARPMPLAA